jgi:hypothetical protein
VTEVGRIAFLAVPTVAGLSAYCANVRPDSQDPPRQLELMDRIFFVGSGLLVLVVAGALLVGTAATSVSRADLGVWLVWPFTVTVTALGTFVVCRELRRSRARRSARAAGAIDDSRTSNARTWLWLLAYAGTTLMMLNKVRGPAADLVEITMLGTGVGLALMLFAAVFAPKVLGPSRRRPAVPTEGILFDSPAELSNGDESPPGPA